MKTLRERLLAFETALNDNEDVYAGQALQSGKGLEKARKGRQKLAIGNDEAPIVVIDSTVWGSVEEGFYITENQFRAKELYEDRHSFHINEIHSVHINEPSKAIVVNGVSFKWLGDAMTPKMKIIAGCIQEHLNGSHTSVATVQQGRGAYLKSLENQLHMIGIDLTGWNVSLSSRCNKVVWENMEKSPMGGENFLERTAIGLSRSSALETYDKLKSEAQTRIRLLNTAVPVVHAREQCKEFDIECPEFSFDFGQGPDRNKAISNEDWQNNTDNAIYRLQECGMQLGMQLDQLAKSLVRIREEECDEEE